MKSRSRPICGRLVLYFWLKDWTWLVELRRGACHGCIPPLGRCPRHHLYSLGHLGLHCTLQQRNKNRKCLARLGRSSCLIANLLLVTIISKRSGANALTSGPKTCATATAWRGVHLRASDPNRPPDGPPDSAAPP